MPKSVGVVQPTGFGGLELDLQTLASYLTWGPGPRLCTAEPSLQLPLHSSPWLSSLTVRTQPSSPVWWFERPRQEKDERQGSLGSEWGEVLWGRREGEDKGRRKGGKELWTTPKGVCVRWQCAHQFIHVCVGACTEVRDWFQASLPLSLSTLVFETGYLTEPGALLFL